MKILPLLLTTGLVVLAGCNKPAQSPAAPAPDTSAAAAPQAVSPPPAAESTPAVAPQATSPSPAPAATPAPTPAPAAAPAAPTDPALVKRLAAERVPYVCDNEEKVELRIFPDQGVAALWRGGKSTELHQVKAYPPTFRYEAGPVASVEGTPAEFTMQVGAMALTQCKLKQ